MRDEAKELGLASLPPVKLILPRWKGATVQEGLVREPEGKGIRVKAGQWCRVASLRPVSSRDIALRLDQAMRSGYLLLNGV